MIYERIEDESWLESQLKDIWFRSFKVWVNISKFNQSKRLEVNKRTYVDGEDEKSRYQTQGKGKEIETDRLEKRQGIKKEGKSYADVIRASHTNQMIENRPIWRPKERYSIQK